MTCRTIRIGDCWVDRSSDQSSDILVVQARTLGGKGCYQLEFRKLDESDLSCIIHALSELQRKRLDELAARIRWAKASSLSARMLVKTAGGES